MISIEDRLAILDLCARYNYLIDTGISEAWADTFTPDGVFEGPAGYAKGRADLVAFCNRVAKDYQGAMHFTDSHLFETDGDLVQHRCFLSFQVPIEDRTDIWLLGYEDEITRGDGEWRFRARRVAPVGG
jgi:hypothetical protein